MEKETEETIGKESDGSRTLLANYEQADTQGFPGTANLEDPARGFQMSESFFVSDTLEEDESFIPPTQELLIPSTPPSEEKNRQKNEELSKLDDTTLSNLDETCLEEEKKDNPKGEEVSEKENIVIDITSQNDMTQDLMDLDATQELVVRRPDPSQLSGEVQEVDNNNDDDDWNLRFTDTQETQELMTSAKLRKIESANQMCMILEEEPNDIAAKETITTPDESKTDAAQPDEKEENNDSEDEIPPSQSCLSDYQADTHLTYLERNRNSSIEPLTVHSTPDASANGKPLILKHPEMATPSPIPLKQADSIDDLRILPPPSAEKPPAENPEDVGAVIEKEDVLEQQPDTINLSTEGEQPRPRIPCETIDLLSSTDHTMETQAVPERAENVDEVPEQVEMMDEVPEQVEKAGDTEQVEKMQVDPDPVENVQDVPENVEEKKEQLEDKKPVEISSEEQEKITNAYISKITSEEGQSVESSDDIKHHLPDTEPNFMLPPLPPRGRLSRKPRIQKTRKSLVNVQVITEKQLIGKFQDGPSLEKLIQENEKHNWNPEQLESLLSLKHGEEMELRLKCFFSVKNNSVFVKRSFEICHPNHPDVPISPHSGSSSSLQSGEMADVSSSSSAKSALLDTTSGLASQENPQKTSTQNSVANPSTSFAEVFKGQKTEEGKTEEVKEEISPIKPVKGRRGRKPAAAAADKPQPTAKRRRGRAPKAKPAEEAAQSTTDSETADVQRVKRKRFQKPKVVLEGNSLVGEVNDNSGETNGSPGSIIPGVRCMARWQDGYFYPGVVVSQDSESRWSVQFEDNQVKKIPQENVIKVAVLEKGTSVLVESSGDGGYDPGIISGHFREGNFVGYDVELDNGSVKRFSRACVILSNDQAKVLPGYRHAATPVATTINLDNIVGGKRKRRSTISPDAHFIKKPTRISQRLSRSDPNLDSTDASSEKEPEPSTSTASTSTGRSRRRTPMVPLYKDSAPKDPKLFKDYAFILSSTEKRPPPKSYDSEPFSAEEIIPFDKGEITNKITPRGGIILDSFDDVQKCKRKNIFLIADTYLRTIKYIQCLAVGVSSVNHLWVHDCCSKREILSLSSYTLPAGFSVIRNKIVEWHGKSEVLKGKKIFIVSADDSSFVFTWSPVLLAAKAKIVQKFTASTPKSGIDVVVSNHLCPDSVLKTAQKKNIPVVSSEWVIQSLIEGRVLKFDEHPRFKHDHTD